MAILLLRGNQIDVTNEMFISGEREDEEKDEEENKDEED